MRETELRAHGRREAEREACEKIADSKDRKSLEDCQPEHLDCQDPYHIVGHGQVGREPKCEDATRGTVPLVFRDMFDSCLLDLHRPVWHLRGAPVRAF